MSKPKKRPVKSAGDKKRPRPQTKTAVSEENTNLLDRKDDDATTPDTPRGTDTSVKVSAAVGIVAAMILAALVNVLVARNYTRWDFTRGGLYTLSDATVKTLKDLPEPIEVHVLLSQNDPLELSLRHLLDAYGEQSDKLIVKRVDPDRSPAEFLAVQQRFGITAGRADDGRIVTDAAVIVTRGEDNVFFLTLDDFVVVEDDEDMRARPKLEEALTGAIRNVLDGESPLLCFTAGHGELSLDYGGEDGVAELAGRLVKNNYELAAVPALRDVPQAEDALKDCQVLVVLAPSARLADEDAARIEKFIKNGGNALLVAAPVPNEADEDYLSLNLDGALEASGVRLRPDMVFELDPARRAPAGFGETFRPVPQAHAITQPLIEEAERGVSPIATISSSIEPLETGVIVSPLLKTSEQSFGMVDFFGWAKNPSVPTARPQDYKGPLIVAAATQRPGAEEKKGRVVVIGSRSLAMGANWSHPEFRGNALLMENAIAWLASERVFVDIPAKDTFVAGLHMSEDDVSAIRNYVLLLMPMCAAFCGAFVFLRRRRDRRPSSPRSSES